MDMQSLIQDHGALLGLADDDHEQYLLALGTRALAGNWSLGGFNLTNGGIISAASFVGGIASLTDAGATQLQLNYDVSNFTSLTVNMDGNLQIGPSGGLVSIGTLTLASGSITDSSGTIDFVNEHLISTGTMYSDNFKISATNNLMLGVGSDAGTGDTGLFIGYLAGGDGLNTGDRNTAIGVSSLQKNTSGTRNVGLGSATLAANTIGSNNLAIGYANLEANTTALHNVAIGSLALSSVTISGYNTAIGGESQRYFARAGDAYNVSVGYNALIGINGSSTGRRNVTVGSLSQVDCTTGSDNISMGTRGGSENRTGSSNTLIGSFSGQGTNTYSHSLNTFLGYSSGFLIRTGSSNVFLGANAGDKQTTLSNLLIVDNQTRADIATELSNSILYGVMGATPSAQSLRINGEILGSYGAKLGDGGATNYTQISATGNVTLPAGAIGTGRAPLYFQDGTALTTPVAGALEFHDGRLYATNVLHRRALDRTSDVAVATVTVADTTTETTIWTAIMNANSLVAGNMFKFHANGIVSNGDSASSADQVTLRIKVGGTTVATLAPALKKIPVDSHWHITANATQRTLTDGATLGKRAVHIDLDIDDETSAVLAIADIDTEADMDVTVTAEWASADAANTISLYQGFMEYKN